MAYTNSSDTLDQLLKLELLGARISHSSDTITSLSNGLSYYFVEVTSNDGTRYAIRHLGKKQCNCSLNRKS